MALTPQYILEKSLVRKSWQDKGEQRSEGSLRDARREIEAMDWASEYAEPGYTAPKRGVLFANWNHFSGDATELLERYGFDIQFSDEWATCEGCNKAVRTVADSYSWTRSYFEDGCGLYCIECVRDCPESYLEYLEGSHKKANTMLADLTEHGYVLVGEDYEHGWHYGQNDSPEVVANSLREQGVTRFIFQIDSVGQFDVDFSVYVHEDEVGLIKSEVKHELPYDPGTEMGKALGGQHSDYYTMETRTITPEEFVSGSWTKDS